MGINDKKLENDQLEKLIDSKVQEALRKEKKIFFSGYIKEVTTLVMYGFAIAIATYFYFEFVHTLNISDILNSWASEFLVFFSYAIIITTILKSLNVKYKENLTYPIYYNICVSILISFSYIIFSGKTYLREIVFFITEIALSVFLVTMVLDYFFKIENKLELIKNFVVKRKYHLIVPITFVLVIFNIFFNYFELLINFLDDHTWIFTALIFIVTIYVYAVTIKRKHDQN